MSRTTFLTIAGLAALFLLALHDVEGKEPPKRSGKVVFDPAQLESSRAGQEEKQGIIEAVMALHQAWLNQDVKAYVARVTPDVVLVSQRTGKVVQGPDAVAAVLPKEWEAYERPGGAIALDMRVQECELTVDDRVAMLYYRLKSTGGARWKFDEEKLFLEVYTKEKDVWKLAHQTAALSPSNEGSFAFDFAYPVKDLKRATKFYTGLLGEPEIVTPDAAVFHFNGCRLYLDATDLNGFAKIEDGKPNGYAIIYVNDLEAERKRLTQAGVRFSTEIKERGADKYAVCEDPAENIFVLMQRTWSRDPVNLSKPRLTLDHAVARKQDVGGVKDLLTAWLAADAKMISDSMSNQGLWIDTHSREHSVARGAEALGKAFVASWARYDRGKNGLRANMDVDSLEVKPLGQWTVASYRTHLTGTGPNAFGETSLVTSVFDDERPTPRLFRNFIVPADVADSFALELDYTGYPVPKLREAESFYTSVMKLGDPYQDSQYRGYWSENSVFGIYTARRNRDGLPRPHRANGYASLWVRSASEVYKYLKNQGSTFPVIPAINNRAGVDPQPGYIQVLATDTEGNIVLFTEYTGK